MCRAFSCLVTRGNKVYWKTGVDSHEGILDLYKKQDSNLNDEKTPPLNTFARIEIVPPKEDYLNTNFGEWIFQIDESIKPSFLKDKHADLCRQALLDWTKVIYTFNLEEARKPIHPFKIVLPSEITEEHLALLKQWASVRDSVRYSVRASVGDSVWDSVWDSVGDSVWAYVGSLFPLSEWKYIDYKNPLFEKGKYPFQSVVDLWKLGLVPSWDGKVWRLHGGEKAEILWKGTV